ncbi:hypothetical protein JHFBIEKO_4424 [Methylobacterium mesophilicum]|uniref:hypothetical protein n=1 Tax=Methylobacterium mesophilicum TaxID=39956 RepID=UPI001EE3608C|nr:hypothetical protein [Methylobacterium mesophilicum]GJE23958.1 hypothetical protein JHFBIEKO_4424 [Methylobacterium mesophilicum]
MISAISAATLARSAAETNGLSLTPEALSAAADRLAADLAHDENHQLAFDGAAPFRIEAGQVVEIGLVDHILAIVRELGSPVTAPTTSPGVPATRPGKIEIDTPIAAFGRSLAASHDAALVRETEKMPNPWLSGQLNRTNAAIITNKNPSLAAKLKAEAGV